MKLCGIHRRIFSDATTNLHMNKVYYFVLYHLCRHRSGCCWRVIRAAHAQSGIRVAFWNSCSILYVYIYIYTYTHIHARRRTRVCVCVCVCMWFVNVAIMLVTWIVKMLCTNLCSYVFYLYLI